MANIFTRIGRALRLVEPLPVQDESKPKQVTIHVEQIGSSGTENFAGYYSEEYLQQLRGTQAADLWDKMRRSDPKVKMILSAVKNPIKSAQWTVQPGDGSDQSKKQADLISKILFEDLCQSWTQQVSEILTLLDFGFSVFEIIHKVVTNDPKFGTYNSLSKIAWRSPRTIERWNLDPNGNLLSVSQYAFGDLQRLVEIPGEFLLIFTHEKEGDNYEGISALRPCYGPWKRKNDFLKLLGLGMEKFAIPTPYMEVPEGKETGAQFNAAKLVLEKYVSHQQQYILYPAGFKLGFAQSNFDAEKIRSAISAENVEMAHAFLENFLELGQSGSGSYALGTDLSDFFLQGIENIGKNICEIVNQKLIPDLIKLNFGPQQVYPKLQVSGIKDKPGKELAEIIQLLTNSGVIVPDIEMENNFREKYNLPKKSDLGQRPIEQIQPEKPELKLLPTPNAAAAPKLSENGMIALQAIHISKAVTVSAEDAKRLALEFNASTQNVVQNETAYILEQMDPGLFIEGTLRSTSPMEGVTLWFGKLKTI